jgi:hypothetical protein
VIRAPPAAFEIWPENWPTVRVFLSLSTQWRFTLPAMGGPVIWHGLPHTEIEATIRLLGYRRDAQMIFTGIKVMEQAALTALQRKSGDGR